MTIRNLLWIDKIFGTALIILFRPASIVLGLILRRNHDMVIRKQLVVTKIKGGGSLMVALPALLSLRRKYPDKQFSLVCSAEVKSFAELMNIFDEIILVDTNNLLNLGLTSLKAIAKVWRADALINLEIHSRMLTVFSCLTCARNRIGFYHEPSSWQRDVITHLFFYNLTSPVFVNYNQVALSLGAKMIPYADVSNYFRENNNWPIRSKSAHRSIAFAPFCSDLGKERELDNVAWAGILQQHINALNATEIFILGGKGDEGRSKMLANEIQNSFPQLKISNWTGQTSLRQAANLIASADEFITIDSGLNHVARLIGGPLRISSYWGPTDPATRLAPFPNCQENVVYKKLFCSPCVHLVDSPPCKGDNICMKQYVANKHNQYSSGGWLIISSSAQPKKV
jgi:ADP-heptose:LPS heptosyltransferase